MIHTDQRLDAGAREQHADRTAHNREDDALRQRCANPPSAAGTKRRQQREFTLTCFGPRQQQIGHVGTRDQQDEPNGRLQHPDRLAGAAEDLVRQRRHPQHVAVAALRRRKEDMAGVTGAWGDAGARTPGFRERVQLVLRRRRGDVLFQPSNEREVVVVARLAFGLCETEGQPDLRVRVHEIGAWRQDANDLKSPPIDVDAVADDRLRAVRGLPELVRDQRHGLGDCARAWKRRRADVAIIAGKETPLGEPNSQNIQQVRVDDGRADAKRALASHEIGLVGPERADLGERAVELLELEVLGHRNRERLARPRGQVHQLRGVRVRQRPQQDTVDDGENGGVGADPERDRQQRDRREHGTAPE